MWKSWISTSPVSGRCSACPRSPLTKSLLLAPGRALPAQRVPAVAACCCWDCAGSGGQSWHLFREIHMGFSNGEVIWEPVTPGVQAVERKFRFNIISSPLIWMWLHRRWRMIQTWKIEPLKVVSGTNEMRNVLWKILKITSVLKLYSETKPWFWWPWMNSVAVWLQLNNW